MFIKIREHFIVEQKQKLIKMKAQKKIRLLLVVMNDIKSRDKISIFFLIFIKNIKMCTEKTLV